MNHCAMQQGSALSAREDMRSCSKDFVVCPKPRRLGLLNDLVRSFRWHFSHQAEFCDSNAGFDILDNILTKGSFGVEQFLCTEMASQHPFYNGSPPSRVANPLIQDAQFGDEQLISSSALSPIPALSCQLSKPVVKVEGFDCRDKDQRNRNIPTLA
ncbi:unnamed protein product [Malus baccata var. baccata]